MRSISYVSAFLACLSLGGLGALTIADLFDGPGTERQERVARTPPLPEVASQLPRYLAAARHYVGERYALKEQFITLNGLVKLSVFGHSPADNVGLGGDGFLFLMGEGAVDLTQGRGRMSAAGQAQWLSVFRDLKEAFDREGIGYGFVIGPNKHTIYADRLPSWVRAAPMTGTRTTDVIGAARDAFGPGYQDARKLLTKARADNPQVALYHPSDTHWTEWGAALVVHDALSSMGLSLPVPMYEVVDLPRSGDLSRMIGQQGLWSATAPVLPSQWSCRDTSGALIDVITIDPLMPQRFTCGSPQGLSERLVVFHDSFGVSAIPYLAARFQQVEFIWSDQADPTQAAQLGADYVLHIQVERKMTTDTPGRFLKQIESGQ